MAVRQQFEDDARLAMALGAEHDGFIGPLHPVYLTPLRRHCEERSDEPLRILELTAFFGQFHSRLHSFFRHLGFPPWLGMTRF